MKLKFVFSVSLSFMLLFSETSVMDIYIGSDKVGWYQMTTEKKDSLIEVTENSKMSITVYGNAMNVSAHSFSLYDSNWSIIKFLSGVESEQLSFFVNGFVKNKKLTVKSDIAQGYTEDVIDIAGKVLLFNVEAATKDFVGKSVYQYNPLTRKLEKITIGSKEADTVKIMGKKIPSDAYNFKSESGEWRVYFNKEGEVIKTVSSEGITMIRTDSAKDVSSPIDILNWFFIYAEGDFKSIGKAKKAVFVIEGARKDSLSNYRQMQKGDTITVSLSPFFVPEKLSQMDTFYLKAGERVKEAAREIKKKANDDSLKLMQNAVSYVYKKLKKGIYSGLKTSEEILKQGYGDCTEHAQLFASIANELGFKCDIVSGIVYSKDGFYYHAWNRILFRGNIYTLDATFNQYDADVSHIQLSEGFPPVKVLFSDISSKVSVRRIE
ncbi:MAG: transglutaminase-like domain-containing protein [bacterium]|nr:transglutaminase-like domain-containing protein [bacterium]